jgi:hypothetical protein
LVWINFSEINRPLGDSAPDLRPRHDHSPRWRCTVLAWLGRLRRTSSGPPFKDYFIYKLVFLITFFYLFFIIYVIFFPYRRHSMIISYLIIFRFYIYIIITIYLYIYLYCSPFNDFIVLTTFIIDTCSSRSQARRSCIPVLIQKIREFDKKNRNNDYIFDRRSEQASKVDWLIGRMGGQHVPYSIYISVP